MPRAPSRKVSRAPRERTPRLTAGPRPDLVDPDDLADKGVREPRVIGPGFHENVFAVVRLVPAGWVTTYGDVGTMLGSARIARQVGWALANLPATASDVPWHRVVNAQGMVSFKGDLERAMCQEALLADEGHTFDEHGRVELESRRFRYPGVAVPFRRAPG